MASKASAREEGGVLRFSRGTLIPEKDQWQKKIYLNDIRMRNEESIYRVS
jgi:hypothetical protein